MINTPFNYMGSKYLLLPKILPLFDYSKSLFVDLFAGSFVVGTNVIDKYNKILANDIVDDLIKIMRELINNPYEIIKKTKILSIACKDDENKYYELRDSYNKNKSPEKLWALISWGKRSWNLSTEFKVKEFVKYIYKYKNKIYFSSVDFSQVPISSNGFYYIDPPYTLGLAGYSNQWKQKDDERLYDYIKKINDKKGSFALSGLLSHNNETSELLTKLINDGFNYKKLDFNYNKVSKTGNKDSQEIIIMNY